jgi:hypothetical protein
VHIRTYHFILPFHQIRPSAFEEGRFVVAGHSWVPMDDENTMVFNTTFRSVRNRRNDYPLDRQVQKTESFTGIEGINTQDRAVQESMGPVVDRSREHLGPADKAVIQARRLLLEAVKTVQAGRAPRGTAPSYYALRAAEGVVPKDADWRELLTPDMGKTDILQTV